MPMGKGTYGSKVGRPPMKKKKKKSLLTQKQKTLPLDLQKKIIEAKCNNNSCRRYTKVLQVD